MKFDELEVDAVLLMEHSSFADAVKYDPYDGSVWHGVVNGPVAYVHPLLQNFYDPADREVSP